MARVFIPSCHPRFGQGIENLLRRQTGLEISGSEKEVTKAIERIKELGPEKERSFLEEHITRWILCFCDVMVQEARLDFYRGIARMTKGFVLDEAQKVAELVEWARAAEA